MTLLSDYWDNWKPTPDNINSLPEKVKNYVCGLETLCDPAGIVAENMLLKDEMEILRAAIEKEVSLRNKKIS